MYQNYYENRNYQPNYKPVNGQPYNQNDDRLIGGFAFPFLLGGVTGAALAPAFWNRPPYGGNYYYPPYQYNNYYYPPYYYRTYR